MKHESELTTLTISLPWAMREFFEAHAARSGCATASEYMRRLILEAQKGAAQRTWNASSSSRKRASSSHRRTCAKPS
jgi:hypothetical protein